MKSRKYINFRKTKFGFGFGFGYLKYNSAVINKSQDKGFNP